MLRRKRRKVPIEKELENCKAGTYKERFIDSLRLIDKVMSSLSTLADNLAE